jgi:hypothetical protein
VPDAAAVDARLRAVGVRVVLPLRDEPFGQGHVMVADPNDVLVDVVQPIPVDPDWLARQRLTLLASLPDADAASEGCHGFDLRSHLRSVPPPDRGHRVPDNST